MYKYKIIKHTCGFGVNHLNLDGFYDMPTHSSGRFLMLCAPAFFLKKKEVLSSKFLDVDDLIMDH